MAKKTLTAAQVVEFLNTTNGRALKTDVVQHFLDQGLDVKINHISGVCWDKTGPLRSEKEYISLTSIDPLPQKVKAPKAPKAPKALESKKEIEKSLLLSLKTKNGKKVPKKDRPTIILLSDDGSTLEAV